MKKNYQTNVIEKFLKAFGINGIINWNSAKCKHQLFKSFKQHYATK